MSFGVVDVRDVADLHLRAMTNPAAKGERFLAVAGDFLWMVEIAKILKARMGEAAKRVPTRQLPNWLVRLAALRDPAVKQIVPELGKWKNATSEKAQPRAWVVAAIERRCRCCDGGEPFAAGVAEGEAVVSVTPVDWSLRRESWQAIEMQVPRLPATSLRSVSGRSE